jgi:hypothetical protein
MADLDFGCCVSFLCRGYETCGLAGLWFTPSFIEGGYTLPCGLSVRVGLETSSSFAAP